MLCPICWAKAPHRLAALWLDTNLASFRDGGMFLHVAPEPGLRRKLARLTRELEITYHCGHIGASGEEFLDLCNLPFADGSVQLVYCCHVLNSMPDDFTGMREVARVLAPGGVALLQVPAFHQGETTLEAPTEAERLEQFQDLGVWRCYTDADYIRRLESVGFTVAHHRASDYPPEKARRCGLRQEVLHLCTLPGMRVGERSPR